MFLLLNARRWLRKGLARHLLLFLSLLVARKVKRAWPTSLLPLLS